MLDTQPDDPFLRYALALEHISVGEDDKAQRIFEDLIHTQPEYFATYYHFAKLLERKGEMLRAHSIYEKGLEITKSLGESHAFNELRSAYDESLYD